MDVMKRLFWSGARPRWQHTVCFLWGNGNGLLTHRKQTEGLKQDTTSRLDVFVDPVTKAYSQTKVWRAFRGIDGAHFCIERCPLALWKLPLLTSLCWLTYLLLFYPLCFSRAICGGIMASNQPHASELCVHKALWPFMQKWIKQSQAFMTLDVVKYCDHVCNVLWLLICFMLHYTVYFTLWWLTAALMMHNVLSVLQHIMPVDCRYGLRTKCYWSFFYFRAALLV